MKSISEDQVNKLKEIEQVTRWPLDCQFNQTVRQYFGELSLKDLLDIGFEPDFWELRQEVLDVWPMSCYIEELVQAQEHEWFRVWSNLLADQAEHEGVL